MKRKYDQSIIDSLQVFAFNHKNKLFSPSSEYVSSYTLWKSIWEDALANEMNIKSPLRSDNFTRQTSVISLFRDKECLGLFTSNTFNLNNPADLNDSYFIDWSPSLLSDLRQETSYVMTYENYTLSRAIRGSNTELPWKELLLLLGLQRQLERNCSYMIATPRKNRSVHKATQRAGAKTLVQDIPYKIPGEIVDLIAWDKRSPQRVWDPDFLEVARALWRKRIETTSTVKPDLTIAGGKHAA